MKKFFVSTSLLAIGIVAASLAANQEASMSGFQFLDFLPSPRQAAMGYAGTALGGPGFGTYNPASPALDEHAHLNLGYAPLPSDVSLTFCEGAWSFLNMFAAASFTNQFISGIIPADFVNGPNYNLPGSYNGAVLSLDFGYKGERLGLGLAINGMQERIVSYTSYGISVSAGLTYRLIPDRLTLGVAVLQLGSTSDALAGPQSFGQGYPLPRSGRAGLVYSDKLFDMGFSVDGDVVYRDVGLKVSSISQIANRVMVPFGAEIRPNDYISVRLGKRFNDETNIVTFGAGVKFAVLSFDMACAITSLVSDIEFDPYLALTYTLASPAKKPVSVRQVPSVKPLVMPPAEVRPAQVAPTAVPNTDSTSRPDSVAGNSSPKTISVPPAPAHSDSTVKIPHTQVSDSTALQNTLSTTPVPAVDSGTVKQPAAAPKP
jgi:hypothetical protein